MQRLLISLFAVLFIPSSTFDSPSAKTGTCIIYVRTPKAFWVGADSLNIQLKTGQRNTHTCKIHRTDNTYFAFAGTGEVGGFYDASMVAQQSISSSSSALEARDSFIKSMTPLFEKAIPSIRRYYPTHYAEAWERPGFPKLAFFEVIFFGFENNSTTVEYAAFHVQKLPDGHRRVTSDTEDCPGKGCSDNGTLRPIGKNKAFQPPFDRKSVSTGNPALDIQRLIKLEMDTEPQWVGGTINILRLDALGGHWLTNYPECPEK